jgi:hypothetical protein
MVFCGRFVAAGVVLAALSTAAWASPTGTLTAAIA